MGLVSTLSQFLNYSGMYLLGYAFLFVLVLHLWPNGCFPEVLLIERICLTLHPTCISRASSIQTPKSPHPAFDGAKVILEYFRLINLHFSHTFYNFYFLLQENEYTTFHCWNKNLLRINKIKLYIILIISIILKTRVTIKRNIRTAKKFQK